MEMKNLNDLRMVHQAKVAAAKRKYSPILYIGLTISGILSVLLIIAVSNQLDDSPKTGLFSRSVTFLDFLPSILPIIVLVAIPIIIYNAVVNNTGKKEREEYRRYYKKYFVEKSLNQFFTDVKYNYTGGINEKFLENTGLIYTGDIYSSEDLVMGKYKDVGFTQADVHVQQRQEYTDEDGKTQVRYVTVFAGRYMVFEFPKKFSSKLLLTHHGAGCLDRKMQKMETESVEFNKTFKIFTSDGMEAFYILMPDFMERAQELARSHDNCVEFAFVDNKMIVGINDGKDVFEPPEINAEINENAELEKISKELEIVTGIVDKLKLTKKVI